MFGLCPVLQPALGIETMLRLEGRDTLAQPAFEHLGCDTLRFSPGLARIQVHGTEHGLDRVGQRARVCASTSLEVTAAEIEIRAQAERLGDFDQRRLRHERCSQPGEFPFRKLGETPPHGVGGDEVEHRIAEELEHRIARPARVRVFVGPRPERKRDAEQRGIGERVTEPALQGFDAVLRIGLGAIVQPHARLGKPVQDFRKPGHGRKHTPIWTSDGPRAYHRDGPAMKEHIDTITDLLLGAAYADKRLEGEELRAITKMVCKLLGADELPDAQAAQLKAFNPAKFDVAAAAGSLSSLSDDDKKRVLDLVASLNESDDVIDMDEDAYLRKVANGLGVDESVIAEHTIEILSDEDLDGMLAE